MILLPAFWRRDCALWKTAQIVNFSYYFLGCSLEVFSIFCIPEKGIYSISFFSNFFFESNKNLGDKKKNSGIVWLAVPLTLCPLWAVPNAGICANWLLAKVWQSFTRALACSCTDFEKQYFLISRSTGRPRLGGQNFGCKNQFKCGIHKTDYCRIGQQFLQELWTYQNLNVQGLHNGCLKLDKTLRKRFIYITWAKGNVSRQFTISENPFFKIEIMKYFDNF